uniref:Uncharacterized protein n=1 Tax=Meloidogyne enterolobii TaxID=390850 RepID=A0A6V7Y6Y1_MELEN|nr:unnamed protein product [Meloidogyne enterolobii]
MDAVIHVYRINAKNVSVSHVVTVSRHAAQDSNVLNLKLEQKKLVNV